MRSRAIIIGTGSALPSCVVTNYDLEARVDTSDEWIRTRTGILERRIASKDENNSDLAVRAALNAMEMAGVRPDEIDLILVATLTPDMPMPSVACLVQKGIGAFRAGVLDISATCSGFIYGLSIADKFIQSDRKLKILVIGSEVLSRRVNWQDRTTCVLFGDGAGAAVLTGTREDRGILSTHLHGDGRLWELLAIRGLGTAVPVDEEMLSRGWQYIQMQGKDVFKHAVRALEAVTWEAMDAVGWKTDALDMVFCHQANMRILDFVRERLGLSEDKLFINIHKYGNTSAASIPIALDEANREGRLFVGANVLMMAFGGGFTWGSLAMRW